MAEHPVGYRLAAVALKRSAAPSDGYRTTMAGLLVAVAAVAAGAGCGAAAGNGAAVTVTAIPLNPADGSQDRVGTLHYAGGVVLLSPDESGFHDLSDLEVSPGGELVAIGDKGQFVRARLVFDARGRLTGLSHMTATRLTNVNGQPLGDKEESDAEGLARLPNGDLLVSFERQHRIWLYPGDGGPPRPVPAPAATFPDNGGLEAIAADPESGPSAYVTAGEVSGDTWRCTVTSACVPGPALRKDPEFGVVAARSLPHGRRAWLLRATVPSAGQITNVITLRIDDASGRTLDEQQIRAPLTVDNFEGLSAVARPDGTLRFYLVSDDNTPTTTQRTLLLAFDWRP